MVRVVEDPTGQALNTDYVFDTLGNLRKTIQGEQNRFFMHDSLGRLLYAKQPEQDTRSAFVATDPVTGNTAWSVKYEYDNNSNITKTTDARGIEVTGSYDNLNRIKLRDYSDATPDVSFYYDGTGLGSVPAHSKGKTTKVSSSVSETRFMTFDEFGRVKTHRQTTDGTNYDTAYTYNLSGALIEETYPSTRVVKYTLDQNGSLAQVQSKKTANHGYSTYADSFSYDPAGAVKKMQLGNGRWETAQYNERLQIKQIGLGTTDADQNLLKLELSYGTSTQNNGSLREQKITVPGIANPFIQTYTYDDLNRLKSATETNGGSETWKQTFEIDRYGNREFDPANTTTLGSCATAVCNPNINTSDNRFSAGQGYSYDLNGNVTQDATGQRFGYDAENHQKEFFAAGNATSNPDATYLYDVEGRRVKKTSNTETTVFVYNAGGTLVAEYSKALATTPQVSYLTTDHLGSPRIVTDEKGTVRDRKDYSAFGEESTSAQRSAHSEYSAADQLRKNYTGYEKDSESGLEFAQARYYSPTHGRFTSGDPLMASANVKNPQTLNRYSYVLNSPYKSVDPLGLISFSTGACGQWCRGSDSGSESFGGGGGGGGHDSAAGDYFENQQEARQPESPPNGVNVTEVSIEYSVSGTTAKEAAQDAIAKAPAAGVKRQGSVAQTFLSSVIESFNENTDMKFTQSVNSETGEVSFTVEILNVTINATIETIMPNWSNKNTAEENERDKWNEYSAKLAGFEKEHSDDTRKRLNEYRDALIGMKATGRGSSGSDASRDAANQLSAHMSQARDQMNRNINADGDVRDRNGGHIVHIR